jgi:hypothetical protein
MGRLLARWRGHGGSFGGAGASGSWLRRYAMPMAVAMVGVFAVYEYKRRRAGLITAPCTAGSS